MSTYNHYLTNKIHVTYLPLHSGKAPKWLMNKMIKLTKEFIEYFLSIHGHKEFILTLSNQYWFQAYSCFIGFDWHSSGTTTTTCYAIKQALKELNCGIELFGGKGTNMQRVKDEMSAFCSSHRMNYEKFEKFFYISKKIAKADNTLLQDTYDIYHHAFILSEKKYWCAIQQGMNLKNLYARRYHWNFESYQNFFLNEAHSGIHSESFANNCINMLSKKSDENRNVSLELASKVINDDLHEFLPKVRRYYENSKKTFLFEEISFDKLNLPNHHEVKLTEDGLVLLKKIANQEPANYEELFMMKGLGKKVIRALALASLLLYN
ncbi:MAG: DUF763 domain-containing protein, partial [Candidatus Anstonellales archaeon]